MLCQSMVLLLIRNQRGNLDGDEGELCGSAGCFPTILFVEADAAFD